MKVVNKNVTGLPDIRGDVSPFKIGDKGTVIFPDHSHEIVVIKDILSSYTDEYLDDYLVIDLPGRPNCWVVVAEFIPYEEIKACSCGATIDSKNKDINQCFLCWSEGYTKGD